MTVLEAGNLKIQVEVFWNCHCAGRLARYRTTLSLWLQL